MQSVIMPNVIFLSVVGSLYLLFGTVSVYVQGAREHSIYKDFQNTI
jgi:hypothetical protein